MLRVDTVGKKDGVRGVTESTGVKVGKRKRRNGVAQSGKRNSGIAKRRSEERVG